jgi:PDZ domain-containing protein
MQRPFEVDSSSRNPSGSPPSSGGGGSPRPTRKPRRLPWRLVAALVACAALTLVAFYVPLPIFYAYLPGPVRDVEGLVEVTDARSYSSEGTLYLTTVSIDVSVTFADWVRALIDGDRLIVSKEQVTRGLSFDELEKQQQAEMRQSKQQAEEVALTALGYEEPTGDGAQVVDTLADSPASGALQADDVIVGVDGKEVSTICDATERISEHQPGDTIKLAIERGGRPLSVTVVADESPQDPGEAFVGVRMETRNYIFDPDVAVDFKTGEIAGPSAGLMFSLALYDKLTPEDLTHGGRIAGTGTIGCNGEVGPIGGIQQKVAGAEAEGATVFLAPKDNFNEASAAAGDIEVVPVATFDEARHILEGLD